MKKAYITSAFRSPIGSLNGGISQLTAPELGSQVIKKCLAYSGLSSSDPSMIFMGNVLTTGVGQNPARQAALKAGIDKDKIATTINQVCGSGLTSVGIGFNAIKCNDANIVIAGGQENMSLSPHYMNIRRSTKMGDNQMKDSMIIDGLWDVYNDYHMGITAENVAKKYSVIRNDQDEFALNSQLKAQAAIKLDKFKEEIVPIVGKFKKDDLVLNKDEHPKKNLNLEKLAKLKSVFKKDGTVTAGNSSGINDGAASLVLMSEDELKKRKLKPLVEIVSWAEYGVDPSLMGTGPIPASNLALKKAGWKIKDLDLVELNEAFAAQSLAVINELKLNNEIINVNGGAIALGHPIGASGARILVTLIHEMIKRDSNKGLAALCIGGGMGIAMCIQKPNL